LGISAAVYAAKEINQLSTAAHDAVLPFVKSLFTFLTFLFLIQHFTAMIKTGVV